MQKHPEPCFIIWRGLLSFRRSVLSWFFGLPCWGQVENKDSDTRLKGRHFDWILFLYQNRWAPIEAVVFQDLLWRVFRIHDAVHDLWKLFMSIQGLWQSRRRTVCNKPDQSSPGVAGSLRWSQGVDRAAFNWPLNDDYGLRYVRYFLFDRLYYLILNYILYTIREEWEELRQLKVVEEMLLQGFTGLPYSVFEVFKLERLFPPRPEVVELGEEWNVARIWTAESSQVTLVHSTVRVIYLNPAWLYANRYPENTEESC